MATKLLKKNKSPNLLLILFIIIAIALTTYAITQIRDPRSNAAKPGSGSQVPTVASCSTCTLAVSPNPVPENSWYTATGCGYEVGAAIQISMYTPYAVSSRVATAGANGCISFGWNVAVPGSY